MTASSEVSQSVSPRKHASAQAPRRIQYIQPGGLHQNRKMIRAATPTTVIRISFKRPSQWSRVSISAFSPSPSFWRAMPANYTGGYGAAG